MAEAVVVGKIAAIQGNVFAKGAGGVLRQLRMGDPVFEGEIIQPEAGGRIELQLNDGSFYALRDGESVTMDSMLFGNEAQNPKDAALFAGKGELDTIAKAIAEGSSLDNLLEETAAGQPGTGEEGHSFVLLLRVAEGVQPEGFDFETREPDATNDPRGGGGVSVVVGTSSQHGGGRHGRDHGDAEFGDGGGGGDGRRQHHLYGDGEQPGDGEPAGGEPEQRAEHHDPGWQQHRHGDLHGTGRRRDPERHGQPVGEHQWHQRQQL